MRLPFVGRLHDRIAELEAENQQQRRVAVLQAERIIALTDEIDAAQNRLKMAEEAHRAEIAAYRKVIHDEQQTRMAAQRGLVPYVRSLEEFDKWLLEHADLRATLEPVLKRLGLWGVRLGYDPDKDLSLSVLSPDRA